MNRSNLLFVSLYKVEQARVERLLWLIGRNVVSHCNRGSCYSTYGALECFFSNETCFQHSD